MMTRKQDPRDAVIHYFTVADPTELQLTLAIVKQIVRSRQPPPGAKKAAPPKRKGTTVVAEPMH